MYVEENISTLQYAGKASFISNKPMRNDDPRMRLIESLKKENKLLNEELLKANDTI
jgi:kinesin family protein 4/21/27